MGEKRGRVFFLYFTCGSAPFLFNVKQEILELWIQEILDFCGLRMVVEQD